MNWLLIALIVLGVVLVMVATIRIALRFERWAWIILLLLAALPVAFWRLAYPFSIANELPKAGVDLAVWTGGFMLLVCGVYLHCKRSLIQRSRIAIKNPLFRNAVLAVGVLLAFQVVCWVGWARDTAETVAWVEWISHDLNDVGKQPVVEQIVGCIEVEEGLYRRTPPAQTSRLAEKLEAIGILLRATKEEDRWERYQGRPCTWIFPVDGVYPYCQGFSSPIVSSIPMGFYGRDFNVDRIVMLQIGPAWRFLYSWHRCT